MKSYGELLYENLHIRPMQKRRIMLIKDYDILSTLIPKGYISNGANIPRWLWWYKEPNNMDCLPATILHDYLCNKANIAYEKSFDKEQWVADRLYADTMYLKALETLGIKDSKILYIGVKIGAFWHRILL